LGTYDSERARIAAADPLRAGSHLVIYAGRFADINGTADLFQALPRMARLAPKARFVIAGGVPENPHTERRWRKRFDALVDTDVAERTRLTGWLPADALAELYARAALLIAPSRFATFGLTVLEAMLSGVVVLAGRAGALEELLEEGAGVLIPPGCPETIARTGAQLLAEEKRRVGLSMRARSRVLSSYLWSQSIRGLTSVYLSLVK
jgi:glycosyltransferase involved in cell wall biosynthesis